MSHSQSLFTLSSTMGSAPSALTAQSTPAEVGAAVASLGKRFLQYRADAEDNGITGAMALALTDKQLIDDVGVTNELHRSRILTEIGKANKAAQQHGGDGGGGGGDGAEGGAGVAAAGSIAAAVPAEAAAASAAANAASRGGAAPKQQAKGKGKGKGKGGDTAGAGAGAGAGQKDGGKKDAAKKDGGKKDGGKQPPGSNPGYGAGMTDRQKARAQKQKSSRANHNRKAGATRKGAI